jgi:hypothetical protein
MAEQWSADRARLRDRRRRHPEWSKRDLARARRRSLGWGKTGCTRLREAPPDDATVRGGRSRARTHPPPSISQAVIDRIRAIRDQPPAHRQRVPGPTTIRSVLGQDPDLVTSGPRRPRSTRTMWQILTRSGRIAQPPVRDHDRLDLPPPRTAWHLAVKDSSTVPGAPDGTRPHGVATRTAPHRHCDGHLAPAPGRGA